VAGGCEGSGWGIIPVFDWRDWRETRKPAARTDDSLTETVTTLPLKDVLVPITAKHNGQCLFDSHAVANILAVSFYN
jgi:hypothetical protein